MGSACYIATMFRSGYWLLGRWLGAPIRVHFSIILCLLVFSRLRWSPGFFVAYPCLILVHELGHAILVRRTGHRVVGVEVTGLGGLCHWSGNASPFEEALIAWGGVLAQLALYGVAELWLSAFPPTSPFGWEMAATFTHTNLWLIAINLLPIAPLDGARAWTLFRAFKERGPTNLPHGTWRDHSPTAQRGWFDSLSQSHEQAGPGRAARARGSRARAKAKPRATQPAEHAAKRDYRDESAPLSAETQQALDRLLKDVTGKARSTTGRSRPE